MSDADVIVIGGGAAGLMCAITAGLRGRRVLVLEGSNKIGKKILMSGGGRCNFTNLHTEPAYFLSQNPHFCKSALSRYTQWDFVSLVEKHRIAYHEKTLGQLFCNVSSKDIVAMLAKECDDAKVRILTDSKDISVIPGSSYEVSCSHGTFSATSVVIASGGLSIPKMGASGIAYRIAEQFGLAMTETRAGLVPFTFTGQLLESCCRLSGVSCKARVSVNDAAFTESILFTHRGMSGPAILQASSYWAPGDHIEIDLSPEASATDYLLSAKSSRPRSQLRTILAEQLPKALATELQRSLWPTLAEAPLAEFSDAMLRGIASILHCWRIKPAATEGYRTAEVTLGGIDTDELSSKTMQSKKHAGLFIIGEAADVTGHLGGYNFQWAWSSGWAAGQIA